MAERPRKPKSCEIPHTRLLQRQEGAVRETSESCGDTEREGAENDKTRWDMVDRLFGRAPVFRAPPRA